MAMKRWRDIFVDFSVTDAVGLFWFCCVFLAAALRDPIAPETGELGSHEHRAPAGCPGALMHDARDLVEVPADEPHFSLDVLIALPIHESRTRF